MALSKGHIVVLGAGVIGLQTAVTLLEAGFAVTVLAEHWPDNASSISSTEWASPWAGAQWRAHAQSHTESADWEVATYHAWAKQAAAERAAGHASGRGPSSLAALPMEHFWHADTRPPEWPVWWSTVSPATFAELPADELPAGMASGVRMQSFTLHPTRYLLYLLGQVRALGGREVRTRVELPSGVSAHDSCSLPTSSASTSLLSAVRSALPPNASPLAALVNCTGLGAGRLVSDHSMSFNRGQTLLVRGEVGAMRTRIGQNPRDVLAVIPRPGTGSTIIGSSRGPGRVDAAEDPAERAWLLREGARMAPELVVAPPPPREKGDRAIDMVVEAVNVGFRPRREGGPRVESEEPKLAGTLIVHAYGHDGAGYQQSVGTAEKVLRLVETGLQS